MKVLHVVDSLRRGGAETLVVDLVEHLARTGLAEPSLLVVDGTDADPGLVARAAACVPLHHLGGLRLYDPRLPVRVRRRIEGAQVLHAHLVYSLVAARFAGRLGRRVPDVATVHTAPGALAHGTRVRTLADVHTAFLSARLVAPAASIAAEHAAACRPRPRRIDVVPNAAVPRARTPGLDAAAVRRALQVPDEALLVVAIARLDPGKGLADLVAAVRRLPGVHLRIAGSGPQRDELEAAAADDADGRIALLGQRGDVGDLLAAADVFCLPSYHEALPISIIEAMHAGVPCLATRVGAIAEVLDEGACGVLVDPGDVDGLVAALRRLHDDGLRRELGAAARARAAERHTMAAMAEGYARIYRDVTT